MMDMVPVSVSKSINVVVSPAIMLERLTFPDTVCSYEFCIFIYWDLFRSLSDVGKVELKKVSLFPPLVLIPFYLQLCIERD